MREAAIGREPIFRETPRHRAPKKLLGGIPLHAQESRPSPLKSA
jgi:hypothetical protein